MCHSVSIKDSLFNESQSTSTVRRILGNPHPIPHLSNPILPSDFIQQIIQLLSIFSAAILVRGGGDSEKTLYISPSYL